MLKTLIIIPAYNEEKNIESVVDNILCNYSQYDYVVVNDGSTDETGKICSGKGYNILNLPVNLGIGGAVQAGYLYALKNGYDVAVQIDGDGQHDVSYISQALKIMNRNHADVVIGSRFIQKEGFQTSGTRRMGIQILSWVIWLCTGEKIRDVTSGFRAVNKRFIKIYAEDYPRDYPEPEAILMALMYGGKVEEMSVIMRERQAGQSTINLSRSIYYMIKVTLAIIIRRISWKNRE